MGQTLTHGVYLPDEGERNCYNGLAANWSILDGAVGTIAEHSTQIAGKAPAVHTHTKADITDFPAYGNTAGTICEGNDSRLSDARTPVAHTHGKSDVTDLLNSNFIPSANNSYDLGSSSYQWNNLYAKNYYYNGVAWGLDKANVWTNTNTFQQNITYEKTNFYHQIANPSYILKDTILEKGSLVSSAHVAYPGLWHDKNGAVLGYVRFVVYDTGSQRLEFRLSNLIKNGALDPTGSTVNSTVCLELPPSGEKFFIPELNNDVNLGSSTRKWKTLNGINPGALSLPDMEAYTDLTSNIPSASLDGITNINLSSYITTKGWLAIVVPDTDTDDFVFCQNGSTLSNRYFMSGARGNGFISLMMPINNTGEVKVQIKASSVSFCRFYPGLGNA